MNVICCVIKVVLLVVRKVGIVKLWVLVYLSFCDFIVVMNMRNLFVLVCIVILDYLSVICMFLYFGFLKEVRCFGGVGKGIIILWIGVKLFFVKLN